jgi:hypothetical protein
MSGQAVSMMKDSERPNAVLPPPPSTPDDGPESLVVPRLGKPPASLHHTPEPRLFAGFPLRTWATFVALFLLGTVLTLLIER